MSLNHDALLSRNTCSAKKGKIIVWIKYVVFIILSTDSDSTIASIILGKFSKYTIRVMLYHDLLVIGLDHIRDELPATTSFGDLRKTNCPQITVHKNTSLKKPVLH